MRILSSGEGRIGKSQLQAVILFEFEASGKSTLFLLRSKDGPATLDEVWVVFGCSRDVLVWRLGIVRGENGVIRLLHRDLNVLICGGVCHQVA